MQNNINSSCSISFSNNLKGVDNVKMFLNFKSMGVSTYIMRIKKGSD